MNPDSEECPLADLNVCHEMEKSLTREQQTEFVRQLSFATQAPGSGGFFPLIAANAAQRAEALRRTNALVAPRPVDMAPLDEARGRMERIRRQIIADRELREAAEAEEAICEGRRHRKAPESPHEP